MEVINGTQASSQRSSQSGSGRRGPRALLRSGLRPRHRTRQRRMHPDESLYLSRLAQPSSNLLQRASTTGSHPQFSRRIVRIIARTCIRAINNDAITLPQKAWQIAPPGFLPYIVTTNARWRLVQSGLAVALYLNLPSPSV